jgi:hypothetical protein
MVGVSPLHIGLDYQIDGMWEICSDLCIIPTTHHRVCDTTIHSQASFQRIANGNSRGTPQTQKHFYANVRYVDTDTVLPLITVHESILMIFAL